MKISGKILVCTLLAVSVGTAVHADESKLHAVFLIQEKEYDTETTLPAFAEVELVEKLGWKCTYLFGNGDHDLPGLDALETADLMVISLRRQALVADQLNAIKAYCASGKPVVGIRTANHAFHTRGKLPTPMHHEWQRFDELILGGNYHGHSTNKRPTAPRTRVWTEPKAADHPVLEGVPAGKRVSTSWLYYVQPLADTATVLMWGQVDGEDPLEPVAWTNTGLYKNRVFFTSLGHQDDFKDEAFRRMLLNGILWAVDTK